MCSRGEYNQTDSRREAEERAGAGVEQAERWQALLQLESHVGQPLQHNPRDARTDELMRATRVASSTACRTRAGTLEARFSVAMSYVSVALASARQQQRLMSEGMTAAESANALDAAGGRRVGSAVEERQRVFGQAAMEPGCLVKNVLVIGDSVSLGYIP